MHSRRRSKLPRAFTAELSPKTVPGAPVHPGLGTTGYGRAGEFAARMVVAASPAWAAPPCSLRGSSAMSGTFSPRHASDVTAGRRCTPSGEAVAADSPKRYTAGRARGGSNLRYGVRFSSALKATYKALGADRRGDFVGDAAVQLSRKLHDRMVDRGGPLDVLKDIRAAHKGDASSDERLALFLWLRDLDDLSGTTFGLRLIASSAYTHWEPWSARRVEAIEETSVYAAVKAVFYAQTITANLKPEDRAGVWRGSYAVPIWATGYAGDAELDTLLIGAVSVNSTALVTPEDDDRTQMSVLSVADSDELEEFEGALVEVVQSCF